jgi:hexokinase
MMLFVSQKSKEKETTEENEVAEEARITNKMAKKYVNTPFKCNMLTGFTFSFPFKTHCIGLISCR